MVSVAGKQAIAPPHKACLRSRLEGQAAEPSGVAGPVWPDFDLGFASSGTDCAETLVDIMESHRRLTGSLLPSSRGRCGSARAIASAGVGLSGQQRLLVHGAYSRLQSD